MAALARLRKQWNRHGPTGVGRGSRRLRSRQERLVFGPFARMTAGVSRAARHTAADPENPRNQRVTRKKTARAATSPSQGRDRSRINDVTLLTGYLDAPSLCN